MFNDIYLNKKVLVTGHTGFKGSWLSLWLKSIGAEICGYSLGLPTRPNHYELLKLNIKSVTADILNKEKLKKTFLKFQPEIVFHLAAQPLVRRSYLEPVDTFMTNIMGTVNILETCRSCESVQAIINITSDKCYENKEWIWGYRESDPVGGHDPYSASKACSEIVTTAYRNSFYDNKTLIATARSGNVIGGGDWAEDRLIPDIVKARSNNKHVEIRNPQATRPWQHVLEPLSGYLQLGQKLLEKNKDFAEAWNFGPADTGNLSVEYILNSLKKHLDIKVKFTKINPDLHEANHLKLDCSKAHSKLNWKPVWNNEEMISHTALWYKQYYEKKSVLSTSQLEDFTSKAKEKNLEWAIK
ncbi:CDP-glucose 4,6-dehydratase [Desulfobacula sp.]|uniref:CDP-glucose 4,6-dehydratase n=1 Tax=Desulfobacula sp. TaxID=2593537 RepID=UPI0026271A02|nr:CDP-glucose 4,6-dehydratase [Desulfobacula sp.]